MANRGYDVVVDVDQEVKAYPLESYIVGPPSSHLPGRPRPHRPARGPRIPQLQYAVLTAPSSTATNQHPQTLKPPPLAAPKFNPTRLPSSPVPLPPPLPAAAASTSSGRFPSTRKPSTSTRPRSCAAAPQPSTRAPTSLTCPKETPIYTAPCGSRPPSS